MYAETSCAGHHINVSNQLHPEPDAYDHFGMTSNILIILNMNF